MTYVKAKTFSEKIGNGKFYDVPSWEDFARNFVSEVAGMGVEKITLLGARVNDELSMDFKLDFLPAQHMLPDYAVCAAQELSVRT